MDTKFPTPFTDDETAYFKSIAEGHCPEFIEGSSRLNWIEGALNMAFHLTRQQPSPTSAHLKTGSEDDGFEVEHDPFGVGKKPQKYVITGGDYEMVKPDTISCEVSSICESDDEWFEFVMYLTGYKKEQVERQIANWKRNVKQ